MKLRWILFFLTLATGAQAHAFLVRSEPAVGRILSAAPAALRLEFSEPLELSFSGVEILAGSGSAMTLGKPHFADGANKTLVVDLPALPPGKYQVHWHVVSVDTHRTEGDFAFVLKQPVAD
jgi:methionine-rich copper-binding protein CopC